MRISDWSSDVCSSDLDLGAEPGDLAVGRYQELLEVPGHVAVLALGVWHGGELGVERVLPLAVDLDLLGHREGDAVGGRAEGGDLLGRARLLAHELVARHAEQIGRASGRERVCQYV